MKKRGLLLWGCGVILTVVSFQSCLSTIVSTTPSLISSPTAATVATPPSPFPSPTASKWAVTPASTATSVPTPLSSPLPIGREIPVIFQPTDSPMEGTTWQKYNGQFYAKDRVVRYSLSYPSEWFIYPEPAVGSVQIQNFPREGMLERGITDMGGAPQVKIQVDFVPCGDSGCPQFPDGEPLVLSGLPGKAWVEYDQLFNLTTQTIIVPIGNHNGALEVIIHVSSAPNDIHENLKMAIGYLLFSIKID